MADISDEKEHFSPALREYYDLKRGDYITPEGIDRDHTMLTGQSRVGKTNSSSTIPVIGTFALSPCIGVLLYNIGGERDYLKKPRGKRGAAEKPRVAVAGHRASMNGRQFRDLMAEVRDNEKDRVEVHVVGAPFNRKEPEMNIYTVKTLNDLAEEIARTPNVVVRTFDVYDKPKPEEIALDARNGNLIRGTGFTQYLREDKKTAKTTFSEWELADHGENFDGTQPEFQLPPKPPRPRARNRD